MAIYLKYYLAIPLRETFPCSVVIRNTYQFDNTTINHKTHQTWYDCNNRESDVCFSKCQTADCTGCVSTSATQTSYTTSNILTPVGNSYVVKLISGVIRLLGLEVNPSQFLKSYATAAVVKEFELRGACNSRGRNLWLLNHPLFLSLGESIFAYNFIISNCCPA